MVGARNIVIKRVGGFSVAVFERVQLVKVDGFYEVARADRTLLKWVRVHTNATEKEVRRSQCHYLLPLSYADNRTEKEVSRNLL